MMKYTNPIKFNNSVLSNPKTKRLGTKLFWSLFCPTLMIVIACIMSRANGVGLFIIGDPFDNFSNIMIMGRTILMTLIAALALNTNLNSGRMDFSLGATGILACLLASLIVPGVDTVEHIFQFLLLSILFGMVLGFIHSLVLISTKLPPIVISLGMVGALSIVRFRTAIKDPMDLVYLFWSISVGIICGAGFAVIAVIASVVLTVGILLADWLPIAKAPQILLVNSNSFENEEAVLEVVKKYCSLHKVKARNLAQDQGKRGRCAGKGTDEGGKCNFGIIGCP